MNVLILSPNQISKYNWNHQLFRNEIGKSHNATYYGPGYPNYNSDLTVKEIIKLYYKKNKPDLIMTYGYRYSKSFKGIGEITQIPHIHLTVDYFPPTGKYNRRYYNRIKV